MWGGQSHCRDPVRICHHSISCLTLCLAESKHTLHTINHRQTKKDIEMEEKDRYECRYKITLTSIDSNTSSISKAITYFYNLPVHHQTRASHSRSTVRAKAQSGSLLHQALCRFALGRQKMVCSAHHRNWQAHLRWRGSRKGRGADILGILHRWVYGALLLRHPVSK